MTDLATHLLATGPNLEDEASRERWSIDNDDEAGWALRKLAAAQAEADRIKRTAEAEVTRIKVWQDDAERAISHDLNYFTARLVEYRRRLEAANPNLPGTYKLPGGSIARRAGRESTIVEAADEFVGWATTHAPEAVTVKPLVSAMSKWARTDDGHIVSPEGEVVPGVSVVTAADSYTVKPAAPSAAEDLEPF